jgi:hypothetical protein
LSKKVLGVGLVIVGMALMMIPGVGTALGLGTIAIGAGMGSIAVATVVGMGLMIAGNMLMGPAVPKMPGSLKDGGRDRLFSTLDPGTPRKIAFGNTALANDVRYQTFTGAKQQFIEQIVAVASHKVESIYEIWLDNEKAWSSASGVVAKFSGYLTVTPRNEATSGNGIGIDGVWTSTATLTGCAYLHLKFKLTGPDESTPGPFTSGVTNRVTIRGKGAFVYDPRLDSTAGGSGSHRADDQATWAWNDSASRNPALQLLFYLLGWRINGKLAVGMGLPKARIDLGSFITAANACDESVTLAAGGTEPRYRSDGVLAESDDRTAVVEALCATMNAVMRDAGGKLSIYVLHNDLAAPVASFNANDVLGGMGWDQTPDLSASFNITRGQRTDPSDNALYQPVDYPEVSLVSPDGIDRIDSVNYPLVQSNGQAQRLAKQRLQRNQYQGRLSLTGKPSLWQVSIGDVVQLTLPSFGWTNKLFRVAAQRISRTGETECVFVEENAAIYQWDNNETAAVQAGAPTIYDPDNAPLHVGIIEARGTAEWSRVIDDGGKPEDAADITRVVSGPSSHTFKHAHDGTAEAGEYPKSFAFKLMATSGQIMSGITWNYVVISGTVNGFTASSTLRAMSGTGTGSFDVSSLGTDSALVEIRAAWSGSTRIEQITLSKSFSAPPASSGGSSGSTLVSKTSGFTAISNTTFTDITGDLAATPPGATVNLRASLSFNPGNSSPAGDWSIELKWQRNGVDVTSPAPTVVTGYSSVYDLNEGLGGEPPWWQSSAASLTHNKDGAAATASTSNTWRLLARVSAGGTRTHSVTGSVSVQVP